MEVILLEKIGKAGEIGAVVKVKGGFARNWLLPQGKALRATAENRAYFESQKQQIEARNADAASKARTLAGRMEDMDLVILRQAGETGQLYGSVSARDIVVALVEALELAPDALTRDKVQIKRAIKTIGLHEVGFNLYAETSITLMVNVARSEEEAAEQRRAHKAGEAPPAPRPADAGPAEEGEEESGADETEDGAEDETGDEGEAEDETGDEGEVSPSEEEEASGA